MTKEKTALTQLIERLTECIAKCEETYAKTDPDKYPSICMTTDAMRFAYQRALEMATENLPIEKQQIVDAWVAGNNNIPSRKTYAISDEQYYQNKFEQ